MQVIYDKELSAIAVAWQIEKAQSGVPEQFYGAKLKVMLVHDTAGRFPVGELDVTDGTITFVLPDGLPVGVYGLKAIWSKERGDMGEGHGKALPCREGRLAQHPNHHICFTPGIHPKGVYNRYNVSEVSHVFAVTDVAEESTVGANGGTITVRSRVATYGRDGMDAYERALMLDRTSDGETDWLEKLQVGDGDITWDKLSDGVKDAISEGGSGGSEGVIYFGGGDSVEDIMSSHITTSNPTRWYPVSVPANEKYILFAVPSFMEIRGAFMGGVSLPMQASVPAQIEGESYNIYKSVNTYDLGEYLVVLEGKGGEKI